MRWTASDRIERLFREWLEREHLDELENEFCQYDIKKAYAAGYEQGVADT